MEKWSNHRASSRTKAEVQHDVPHPRCKPFDPLEMKHRGAEIEVVVRAHRDESLNGLLNPGLDAFFLDVHMNVKDSTGGFERQQTGFPNGFA